eukprot:1150964-Pelagomonas_calceolata.AAC.15
MFLKLRKLLDIGGFPLKPLTCSLAQWAGGIPSLKISNVSPRSGQTASPPWNSHVQISVNAQRAGGIPNFTFVAAPPQSAPTAAPASGGAASAPRDVPPSTASAAAGGASPSTASAAGVCLRSRLIVRVRVDLVVHG